MSQKARIKKEQILNMVIHLIAVMIVLVISFPFLWLIMTSFKNPLEVFSITFIFHFTLENYLSLFDRLRITHLLINSLVIASFTVIASVLVGTFAAYSYSRLTFYGRRTLMFLVLFLRMMPPIAGIIPLFLVMRSYG